MTEHDISIGGEQSGHIIIKKYATTGDGILTAIMLSEYMVESKKKLSELVAPVKMYPQTVKNVTVNNKSAVVQDEKILAAVKKVKDELGNNGRILLRESGTEPVVRIMVEAATQKICESYSNKIADLIQSSGY
jgi:phosphoglucosamine mutase